MKKIMKKMFILFLFFFSLQLTNAQMILEFDTNLITGTTIMLPLSGTVNVTVDWGDGSSQVYTTSGYKNHTYATEGIYTVSIDGLLTRFGDMVINDCLTKVISFGDIGLVDLSYAFWHAKNLIEVPVIFPSTVFSTNHMFYDCLNFNHPNICNWDVGNVTDMRNMFTFCSSFNQDIGNWNVSNVIDMIAMFYSCDVFNQDIGNWDVGNVTNMMLMFYSCNNFNQNIGNWDVGNVTNMFQMFCNCDVFNQDIGNWDVGYVTDMGYMFAGCSSFNQNIGNWNVCNVSDMRDMFYLCHNFNQDIGNWDVGNVTNMNGMFSNCDVFNQDIGNWNVGNVTNMKTMFYNCNVFNQDIGNWDVSNVTGMISMFAGCSSFNQDIGNWDASNVNQMDDMFYGATLSAENYDALLNGWSSQILQPNVNFHGGNSKYSCYGIEARNILTSLPNNWTITDGGMTNDINPIIICPENQIINLSVDQSFYTVTGTEFDPLYDIENCGVTSLLNNFNNLSTLNNAILPVGITNIIWSVTNIGENTAQCSFDVTVNAYVGLSDLSEIQMSIFPNPASEYLMINRTDFQDLSDLKVEIYDNSGKIIYSENSNNENVINTSGFNSGIYNVKIIFDGKEVESRKLVIE